MIKIGTWNVDVDDIGIIRQPYKSDSKWKVYYYMKQCQDFTTDHDSQEKAQQEINAVLRLKGFLTESVGAL